MTAHPGSPIDDIRGRLLHEQLLAEARESVASQDWTTETYPLLDLPVAPCSASRRPHQVVVIAG